MKSLYSKKRYIEPFGFPFRVFFHVQKPGAFHYHDFDEIVFVLEGSAMHTADSFNLPISAGDVFVIRKGCSHMYRQIRNLKIANIIYDRAALKINWKQFQKIPGFTALFHPNLREQAHLKNKFSLDAERLEVINQMLHKLHWEIQKKSPGWEIMAYLFLQELFVFLARCCCLTSKRQSQRKLSLDKMMQFIEKNYSRDLTRDEIMHAGMTSNSAGTRIFRDLLGKTPIEYLSQVRIQHAIYLLKNTDRKISLIASECGFRDSNYFSVQFKKATGFSPRRFARDFTETAGAD